MKATLPAFAGSPPAVGHTFSGIPALLSFHYLEEYQGRSSRSLGNAMKCVPEGIVACKSSLTGDGLLYISPSAGDSAETVSTRGDA